MYLAGQYQNAYVTHDRDRAMAALTERFGVGDYILFEPEMTILTPEGERQATVRVALAWTGHTQIELIEPVSGHVGHYADLLPDDPADISLRFHHVAVRRESEAAMRAEVAALGLPVTFEGSVPGAMVFLYVDARATLGHYIEYMWCSPEGWAMQGWPDGRAAA